MKFKHIVTTPYEPTFRSAAVAGMFDVQPGDTLSEEWDVDLPLEEYPDWQIGLIVGPSGSGKTTLAKRMFGEENYHNGFEWNGKSVVDDFPQGVDIKTITKALSSVGFSSPPSWIKPFRVLSNGQKFRAEIARLMLEDRDLVVLDEFTSVVDRQVAKFASSSVERYIRRSTKKKLVAVSCHYDIVEWLQPDWVYDVPSNSHSDGRLLQRPEVEIEIFRVDYSAWRIYRQHHYLSQDIHRASHVYVGFWDGTPVALVAVMAMPHPRLVNAWRSHRTVVLPDFQGTRIGVEMNDAIAHHYCVDRGGRFFGLASHPAMLAHRNNSPKWMLRRGAGMVGVPGASGKWTGASVGRASLAHEYVGHVRNQSQEVEE